MQEGSTKTGPPPGLRLTERQIYLFAFANNVAIAFLYLNLPLRALALGATALDLGVIGGIWSLASICSAVLCGRLSDRLGRDRLMAAGTLIGGLGTLSVLLIPKLPYLFAASILFGISSALFWPSIEAKVADASEDHELGRRLSRFNMSWSSGSGAGTLLSGVLAEQNPALPFCVAAVLFLLLSLRLTTLLRWGKKEDRQPAHPLQAEPHPHQNKVAAFLFMARLAHFALSFSIGSIRWLFPKLAVTLGMQGATIGVALGMLTGSQVLAYFGMSRVRRWQYTFGALLLTLLLPLAGLWVAWSATTAIGFDVAFFAIGLSGGMAFNMSLFYGVHGSHTKGGNAGLHEAIGGLGYMLGPLLGGVVARGLAPGHEPVQRRPRRHRPRVGERLRGSPALGERARKGRAHRGIKRRGAESRAPSVLSSRNPLP